MDAGQTKKKVLKTQSVELEVVTAAAEASDGEVFYLTSVIFSTALSVCLSVCL